MRYYSCSLNVQSLVVLLITICATTNNLLVKFSLTVFTYMRLLKNVLWTLIGLAIRACNSFWPSMIGWMEVVS